MIEKVPYAIISRRICNQISVISVSIPGKLDPSRKEKSSCYFISLYVWDFYFLFMGWDFHPMPDQSYEVYIRLLNFALADQTYSTED